MFETNQPITLELGIEEPAAEVTGQAVVPAPQQMEAEYLKQTALSAEEQKMVDDFCEKIDLKNSAIVLQYGAASQKKVAAFQTVRWKAFAQRIWDRQVK